MSRNFERNDSFFQKAILGEHCGYIWVAAVNGRRMKVSDGNRGANGFQIPDTYSHFIYFILVLGRVPFISLIRPNPSLHFYFVLILMVANKCDYI